MKSWYDLMLHIPFLSGVLVGMGMLIMIGLLSVLAIFWGLDE
jgi:hypothetical protein